MTIYNCMMRQSTCYKEQIGASHLMQGIVVHSTGCNNPKISRYVQPDDVCQEYTAMIELLGKNRYKNDWNHKELQKGVHAFIGKLADNSIATVRVLEDGMFAWGVGKHEITGKSFNFDPPYYQFEICEDDLNDEEYFYAVMKEAQEFCAYLCEINNWDPNLRIVSHKESHDLGYGCDHGDPDYWLKKYGRSMEWFRECVGEIMRKDAQIEIPVDDPSGEIGEIENKKESIFSKIEWKNVLERALWTFAEGFVVALPSTSILEIDGAFWKSLIASGIMALISALKTIVVEIGGKIDG